MRRSRGPTGRRSGFPGHYNSSFGEVAEWSNRAEGELDDEVTRSVSGGQAAQLRSPCGGLAARTGPPIGVDRSLQFAVSERWQSGRMRRSRKPLTGNPGSRVRIPPSPPHTKRPRECGVFSYVAERGPVSNPAGSPTRIRPQRARFAGLHYPTSTQGFEPSRRRVRWSAASAIPTVPMQYEAPRMRGFFVCGGEGTRFEPCRLSDSNPTATGAIRGTALPNVNARVRAEPKASSLKRGFSHPDRPDAARGPANAGFWWSVSAFLHFAACRLQRSKPFRLCRSVAENNRMDGKSSERK